MGTYNPGQYSWDTGAITTVKLHMPLPPPPSLPPKSRCNVDVMHAESFSSQSTLVGGGEGGLKLSVITTFTSFLWILEYYYISEMYFCTQFQQVSQEVLARVVATSIDFVVHF